MSYADVNGVALYYEEHGSSGPGEPLILLHGGLGSDKMYAPQACGERGPAGDHRRPAVPRPHR
jgi:pimeloyl-ACP methyl ester carboxylesterase